MYRFVREDREKLNASHAPLDGHDAAVDRPVDGSDVRPHWAEGKGLTTLELAICDALISGIEKQEIGKRLNRSPSWVTIQIKGIGVKLS
jgi:DNA-binding NarL/FixJ family response regulator